MSEKETQSESFFEDTQNYLRSQIALFKLDTVEKLTGIFSSIMLILLAILLLGGALFYLSLGFIWWSQDIFGSLLPGILIVSGSYIFLLILIYIFRRRWIINPFVKLLCRIFFEETNNIENE
ncbi:MAG: phage holin family protein [Bacteroidota bacterium]|uniref:phage holin family protein n=1 Tax=Parabacteroides sp. FAFU027 TaxID=2922715 RepID=UPI001FB0202C|nr:phage holin family protein [Parabacteroides sp. FAFU027]MDP4269533.1 phage holin family protein [Bacteroidota bacterium]